jgi:AmiR/NasT family two-component response regulator
VVTLTLYGARPTALDPASIALASLLAWAAGTALANAALSDDARRTVTQLEQAIAGRSAVDQAKGMLMGALGCDADEALARMRHLSQTRHVKVTAIARQLIDGPVPVNG